MSEITHAQVRTMLPKSKQTRDCFLRAKRIKTEMKEERGENETNTGLTDARETNKN